MKLADSSKEKLTHQAHELLTYALHIQGEKEETLDCIGKLTVDERSPARCLFMGQLLADYEKWDQAMECLMDVPLESLPHEKIGKAISDALLKAAIHFSEKEDWDQTLKCLAAAQTSFSENPIFKFLPEKFENDLPIVFYQGGAYEKAIGLWEKNLISEGYSPRKAHLLAIAYQALALNSSERPILERINYVVKAHMYWTALSTEDQYWRDFYENRKNVYGPKVSDKLFQNTVPGHGGYHCQMLMDKLQNGADDNKESETQQLLSDARKVMAIEYHSAWLLLKICSEKNLNWPAGGLEMLSVFWGPERLEQELAKVDGHKVGSSGWLLKGLREKQHCEAYVQFLNDAYVNCIRSVQDASGTDVRNLMGLALIARAETALKGQQIVGCQELAEKLSSIPEKEIRNKAQGLLEEMVSKRLKTYLHRRQRDEAIEFAGKILGHVDLASVKETLSGAFLQRSEAQYLENGMEAFLEDYDQAVRYADSLEVCQNHFAKIVRHHLNKLFTDKKFREALSLLEGLRTRYPRNRFIPAQIHFFNALERVDKYGIGNSGVLQDLQKAYNEDTSDKEIAMVYSKALSNNAVEKVNLAINSGALYRIQSAIKETEQMLLKALKIDPTNDHARNNLLEVMKAAQNVGVNLSVEALAYLNTNILDLIRNR